MRRLLPPVLALLLALLAPVASAQQAGAPSPFFPYPMKTERLPNGLTVVRVPFKSPGLVAYYTVVRVGSRNEVEPGKTGFAHFFEHMMFKGTKAHPEGSREKVISKYGYDDNAFTTDDVTVYHSFGPSAGLGELIPIEADRFANLEYSEPSFQTEALAVLGEYHKNAAAPFLKMEEALNATAFKKHTYQHTTLGFYADVKAMPQQYQYSKSFFERWYTPDNTMVFIVGDFDDAKVMDLVRQSYSSWNRKVASVKVPAEPPQREQRSVEVPWPQPTQPRTVFAWHTPAASLNTQDAAIQSVLQAYLVGPTSPLYRTLVLEKQLAESIGSDWGIHRDPHLFTLTATLKDEKGRDAVEEAFGQAVRDLATGRVDAARVNAIKSNLRYGQLMGLETANDVGVALAYYAGVYGAPDAFARHQQALSQVKPQQLIEFAKRYMPAANRTILSLTQAPAAAKKGEK
ncbi:insulinase family protein [Aggregicoccus sp. 17bor-14]|uniref:M16 family metallopeptidase n=1 Tax=Myxococcaceae TaxID=31 RepID=UPI00129CC659|nr:MULTISPECIES: pitrilysin family protein [Myxococcaceae]MBF5044503.1 insulinase family protein [Simulacricoccus sp. 17bor-14]MRI90248.1 insulinase family protein [Aggregicoccus sp. 17bor-14]